MVLALLEAGASTSSQDQYGATALHRAVNKGRLGVVRLLLEAGADPNIQSELGYTALNTRLFGVQGEAVAMVSTLLAAGADPTIPDYGDRTALHNAAQVSDFMESVSVGLMFAGWAAGGGEDPGVRWSSGRGHGQVRGHCRTAGGGLRTSPGGRVPG